LTSTNYDYKDEAYQQIAKQFYIDYMNGIKTKDDFNNYLNELKNAGLDNIVNNIKKLYR